MNHTNKILQEWVRQLTGISKIKGEFEPCKSIKEIVKFYNLHESSRKRKYVEQRQALIKYLYFDLKWTLHAIGELLNKDHSTILHGVRKIEMGYCKHYIYLNNTIEIRNTIKFYDIVYNKNKVK